jgi:hypothetical protein
VVHERIELLQFSLLNRLSPREIKGIVQCPIRVLGFQENPASKFFETICTGSE